MIRTLGFSLLLLASTFSFGQCVGTVDFNDWVQEGPPANGTWSVGGGGAFVTQTVNGEPTFYVSPDTFINVVLTGSITVGSGDDDWVGFVFGFKQPIGNSTVYDCYLFDWKQTTQGAGQEGFALQKISGNIPTGSNGTYFWNHTSDALFNVLATDFGAGKGWVDNTTHQVSLTYSSSQIIIYVDGNLIFDVPGCYDPGRFGFYNYSQANVTYADFDYQIDANYNLITPQICADDTGQFQFVDTTCSGIPVSIASWFWDFGDGNTSTEMNPFHAYASSGTFPVEMIITDYAGCADSVTKNIIIQSEPFANFASTQVCLGATTDFTDGTTLTGGGVIASWAWAFGDGNTSTLQHPSNLYSSFGTYNAFLAVVTDSGCTDTITISNSVYDAPVALFSSGDVCLNDTTFFTNSSFISTGTITWNWDFDDGTTSTLQTPFHVYTTDGLYNVRLVVTSNNNCTDTLFQNVRVWPSLDAGITSASLCFGTTNIFTDATIINGGGTIASWLWDFEDGGTSTVQNPSYLYGSDGTYNVFLTVVEDSGCMDTITVPVLVYPVPNAGFNFNDECLYDTSFFTSTSSITSGTISWNWDFDDSNLSTIESPYHIYSTDGTYNVRLVVISDNLCTDTINVTVEVFPAPVASFSIQPVCFGTNSDFIDLSTLANNYNWIFGDGSPVDNTPNPTHVYTDPLSYSYNVTLIVTTNDGCTDDTSITTLVHPIPVASFSSDTVCQNLPTSFTNSSTVANGEGLASHWWDFGDFSGTSLVANPAYTYANDGTFDVNLQVVSNNGCSDDTVLTVVVDALPTANFLKIPACPGDTTYFTNLSSIDVVGWFWDFDDLGTASIADPKHVYGASGMYNVELAVVNNDGCVDTVNINVESYPEPVAGFTVDPDTTSQVTPFIEFTYASSGAVNYTWNMGNDSTFTTPIDTNFTYIYSEEDTATYTVQQIAFNSYGCRDTFEWFVQIREDFTIFFPNTFTPNGDGINEVFLPRGIGLLSNVKKYNMYIYNRWGDVVFETDDIHEGWDGIANNGNRVTQNTVYVWFVEMDLFGLGKHQSIGHVTLLK